MPPLLVFRDVKKVDTFQAIVVEQPVTQWCDVTTGMESLPLIVCVVGGKVKNKGGGLVSLVACDKSGTLSTGRDTVGIKM